MFKNVMIIICCLVATIGWSQSNKLIVKGLPALEEQSKTIMPALDNASLMAQEKSLRAPGRAPKFAEPIAVDINPNNSGQWAEKEGKSIWRLQINSNGAKSINLGFSQYFMPAGGTFIIYDPKGSSVLGPFTPSDNEVHNELWTPIFNGDKIVLEVAVPSELKAALNLQLSYVNHDYMGFGAVLSGSCNLDVNCSEADGYGIVDGYRDIIRSVAVIGTGGGTFCTGFLINNVNNDGKPFFMTANHCGIDFGSSPSLVAYWNFENSNCREPGSGASGGQGDGTLNIFNTGSVFMAGYGPSDFVLVEFDDPIHPDAGAFLAGFTLEQTPPSDTTIAVHHPSTDEKRISFEFDATHIGAWGQGGAMVPGGDHIIVPDWDIGTTEGGSSGSPLFDKNKRVVGQLHGGGAACGNNDYDSYGWFYSSWIGGGTMGTRLSDYLDPNGTGVTTIDGLDLDFNILVDQSNSTFCAPQDQIYTISVSENFEANVDLTLTPAPPAGVNYTFSNTNPAPGDVVTLSITNTEAFGAGTFSYSIGATDGTNTTSSGINLNIFEALSTEPALSSPANAANSIMTSTGYDWEALDNAQLYDLQVASDAAFTDVLFTTTDLEETSGEGPTLDILTTYYWRVRGVNVCGAGNWSTANSFTTDESLCSSDVYNDDPVDISTSAGTVEVTQAVTNPGLIADMTLNELDIQHSYVGDLIVTLISPNATEAILFDRLGVPNSTYGCDNPNLLLSFDDNASNTAEELENTCEAAGNAASGTYQPLEPLSIFNGEEANGIWTLRIEDAADFDGGQLVSFNLAICAENADNTNIVPQNSLIESCQNQTTSFTMTVGTAYTGEVTIFNDGFPSEAIVNVSPNPAMPGEEVTVEVMNGAANLGLYNVTFTGSDGADTGTGTLEYRVSSIPQSFTLTAPANEEIEVIAMPTLNWEASIYSDEYTVEIAADPGFNTILEMEIVIGETYQVSDDLEPNGTYYWRVLARNDCGTNLSDVFSFSTIVNSVNYIGDTQVNVQPNPVMDVLTVSLNKSFDQTIRYRLVQLDGKQILQNQITPGQISATLNMSDIPQGIYLLEIQADGVRFTEKLVKL